MSQPVEIKLPWPAKKALCSVDECSNPAYGKGFCAGHYDRWLRYGDAKKGGPLNWKPKTCSVEDCARPVAGKGLCNAHYKRQRRHGSATGGGTPIGEPLAFLRTFLASSHPETCEHWPYTRNSDGYARCYIDGKNLGVQQVVCETVYGPAPTPGHEVAHSCGCGHLGCINPKHLRWATRKENHADKILHGTTSRGEMHGNVKLSEEQAREIRSLKGVPLREIADRYGVSKSTACRVRNGKSWEWME